MDWYPHSDQKHFQKAQKEKKRIYSELGKTAWNQIVQLEKQLYLKIYIYIYIIDNMVWGGESYINEGLGLISTNSLMLIDTRTHQSIYSPVSNRSTSTPDQAYASTNKML